MRQEEHFDDLMLLQLVQQDSSSLTALPILLVVGESILEEV